jgi:hypothetical protein
MPSPSRPCAVIAQPDPDLVVRSERAAVADLITRCHGDPTAITQIDTVRTQVSQDRAATAGLDLVHRLCHPDAVIIGSGMVDVGRAHCLASDDPDLAVQLLGLAVAVRDRPRDHDQHHYAAHLILWTLFGLCGGDPRGRWGAPIPEAVKGQLRERFGGGYRRMLLW